MRSTKLINLPSLFMFASIGLLGACSSIQDLANEDKETSTKAVSVEGQEEQAELDDFALKALKLKDQPNQYQRNKPSVPSQAKVKFKDALALKQARKLSAAQSQFLALTVAYPKLSGPWVQLADISLLQGSTQASAKEQAIDYLQKALSLRPDNYFAHNRLAALLRQQGQFKLAEEHYQKAIDSWPGFAEAYLNRGILYDLYLGKQQLALQDYQLYQALVDIPERRVKGWIADLTRQIKATKQEVAKQ